MEKIFGGVIAIISFRLTWDGCSSLLPFGGVLSFQSEAREVLCSDTARLHHAARQRGGDLDAAISDHIVDYRYIKVRDHDGGLCILRFDDPTPTGL